MKLIIALIAICFLAVTVSAFSLPQLPAIPPQAGAELQPVSSFEGGQ